MSTVTALQSFTARLSKDVLGEDRIEQHSEHPKAPSVFPGGKFYPAGYVDEYGRNLGGKLQPAGSLVKNVIKEGRKIDVVKGQNFDSNHDVVKGFPHLFGEVELVHPPIEQAVRKAK